MRFVLMAGLVMILTVVDTVEGLKAQRPRPSPRLVGTSMARWLEPSPRVISG